MTDCSWDQAAAQLGDGIGVYSGFMAKNLNDLSRDVRSFIREAKERAGSRILLRGLEHKLRLLERTFAPCWDRAQDAVMGGRSLMESEFRMIKERWLEVGLPYNDVSVQVQRIGGMPKLLDLLNKLQEAYTTLNGDIAGEALKGTAEHIPHFATALQQLLSVVTAELDHKIDEGLA